MNSWSILSVFVSSWLPEYMPLSLQDTKSHKAPLHFILIQLYIIIQNTNIKWLHIIILKADNQTVPSCLYDVSQ